jgi:hypothetical protein
MRNLKTLITEDRVLRDLLGESHYKQLTTSEKSDIFEAADVFRSYLDELHRELSSDQTLINEGIFDRAKAQFSGTIAGAKQLGKNLSGKDAVDPAAAKKMAMINNRIDTFKKNLGTHSAKMLADLAKGGFDPKVVKKLNTFVEKNLKETHGITIKDTSIMARLSDTAGGVSKAALKASMPIIQKVIKEFGAKMDALYQKSGPIKGFDDKYKKMITSLKAKHPEATKALSKFSKFALKHKSKGTIIIGGLVALMTAAGATGPMAPLIVGVGMRGMFGLLAGEPPAKAFGKAAITALVGKFVGGEIKEFFGGLFDGVSVGGAGDAAAEAGSEAASEAMGELSGDVELWKSNIASRIQDAIDNQDFEVSDSPNGGNTIKGFHASGVLNSLSDEDKKLLIYSMSRTDSSMSADMAREKLNMYFTQIASGQADSEKIGEFLGRRLEGKARRAAEAGNEKAIDMLNKLLDGAESSNKGEIGMDGSVTDSGGDVEDAATEAGSGAAGEAMSSEELYKSNLELASLAKIESVDDLSRYIRELPKEQKTEVFKHLGLKGQTPELIQSFADSINDTGVDPEELAKALTKAEVSPDDLGQTTDFSVDDVKQKYPELEGKMGLSSDGDLLAAGKMIDNYGIDEDQVKTIAMSKNIEDLSDKQMEFLSKNANQYELGKTVNLMGIPDDDLISVMKKHDLDLSDMKMLYLDKTGIAPDQYVGPKLYMKAVTQLIDDNGGNKSINGRALANKIAELSGK